MNPFEIRTRLLELVCDQLNRQYEANLEFANKAFDELVKANKALQSDYSQHMPKVPTTEEVLQHVEKLYGFVKNTK